MYLKKNGRRKQVDSPEMAEAYIKLGWKEIRAARAVPAADEPNGGAGNKPPIDLQDLSKNDLFAMIEERGMAVPMGAKKAELIRILEEYADDEAQNNSEGG